MNSLYVTPYTVIQIGEYTEYTTNSSRNPVETDPMSTSSCSKWLTQMEDHLNGIEHQWNLSIHRTDHPGLDRRPLLSCRV